MNEASFGKKEATLIFSVLLFMAALAVADVTSVKLAAIDLFGIGLLVPVGTLAFALTFLATDIISELYGKQYSVYTVWGGVAMRIFMLVYFYVSIGDAQGNFLFFEVPQFWSEESQRAYSFIFGSTLYIYLAGFVAIIVSSLLDVYLFHYFKEKHQGKPMLWFRNNFCTIVSQLINSTLFISIAFGSVLTVRDILAAVAGQFVAKIILAIFDTPFCYAACNYGGGKGDWYAFWGRSFWAR